MNKLLTDQEVADLLGITTKRLQALRTLDRGEWRDRVPAWIEVGESWRPRVRGTRPEAVEEWMKRHETKGAA